MSRKLTQEIRSLPSFVLFILGSLLGILLMSAALSPMLVRIGLVTAALWLLYKLATVITGLLFKAAKEEDIRMYL